jgi:integrase
MSPPFGIERPQGHRPLRAHPPGELPTVQPPLPRHRRCRIRIDAFAYWHWCTFACSSSRLRVATCQTLLGLLAVTGMRISEACNLNDDDIDHDRGVIRIVNSKFDKSRQVLVHASTLNALADYRQQRDALSVTTSCPALLITGHGTRDPTTIERRPKADTTFDR